MGKRGMSGSGGSDARKTVYHRAHAWPAQCGGSDVEGHGRKPRPTGSGGRGVLASIRGGRVSEARGPVDHTARRAGGAVRLRWC